MKQLVKVIVDSENTGCKVNININLFSSVSESAKGGIGKLFSMEAKQTLARNCQHQHFQTLEIKPRLFF
jgi:hypothetical protein